LLAAEALDAQQAAAAAAPVLIGGLRVPPARHHKGAIPEVPVTWQPLVQIIEPQGQSRNGFADSKRQTVAQLPASGRA
jgi:hypothetical protein